MRTATLFLFSLAALAQQAPFTLEQVLSAPFPSELTAAPSGGRVAWVYNAAGARNIWIAEAPDYRGRALTRYTADDGRELFQLAWSPDGRTLAFVRGEGANRAGEYPNPTSDPAGVTQSVWVAPVAGGAPREIGEGNGPAISARGVVAFVRNGQVWSASLDAGSKPALMFNARGRNGSLRWSPDGARLAFVSSRADHSFIGLYDMATKTLRYTDPGVDTDLDPVFSPDGARIAFIRTRFAWDLPRREGEPWSIRAADVSTGRGREVWRANPGRGSVLAAPGLIADSRIFWAAGGRIVFPWERDGWNHLYSVPVEGGAPTLLTPGDFEVEYVALEPGGKTLLCNSNQGDIDRRHVWRVPVSGGQPVALTKGDGIEWSPVAAGNGTVVLFRSGARQPARPAVLQGSAALRDIAPDAVPETFPEKELVVPQQVVFPAADGMSIHGQLFLPPDLRPGERRPALVFFHGGSRRQMLTGWHYMYYYNNAYGMNQYLARRGYIVLSVNYRSGIGYGLDFRETVNFGANGASEFHDVQGAGLYLRGRPDVDPARIGLWGGSYGGYLTALGLARASSLFAAGVDFHGVHDWAKIRGLTGEAARAAFESSPMSAVKTWRSPVLLIHGDDDRNVAFSQTVDLVQALRRQKVDFEQLIFPDEIHDFLTHAHWLEAYRAADDFFRRKLGR
jgi:dipeptidyl aminopeptidase/acylaminoacyl peptidase